MSPEDDFDLDDGEALSWDCVPQHSHAIDYSEIEKRMIRNTKVTITDENSKVTKQITETFWDEGKNRVVECTDTGPSVNCWELIVEIMINETPPTWEILRLDRAEGVVGPKSTRTSCSKGICRGIFWRDTARRWHWLDNIFIRERVYRFHVRRQG